MDGILGSVEIMDSILDSIKKLIGYEKNYGQFDIDLIIHINSFLSTLNQLGVGPKEGFSIKDDSATWSDFVGDLKYMNSVVSYVYIKVKLIFDPPPTAATIEALNKQASEFEWRIAEQVDEQSE